MTYRKAVDLVLLKNGKTKVPFWYLAWNRELYYIDMKDGMVNIVVPSEFHNVGEEILEISGIKIDSFLDLTRISLPINDETLTVEQADKQENVKQLKELLGIEHLDLSCRYL